MSVLLEASGLVKHLGGRRVVDGVDLVCQAGLILGLLGPNGAGKTTTLRTLYIKVWLLPSLLPVVFVAGCAFAALGLCFTALLPTIDHMNLPIFLLVLPMGLMSATYFPLEHPVLVALSIGNPLYHLAQAFRGLLIDGPVAAHLVSFAILAAVMLGVLVPTNMRLLRRRVLGD